MRIKGELFKTKAFKLADTYGKQRGTQSPPAEPLGFDLSGPWIHADKLRALVERMRADELRPYHTSLEQGYHEASGDWADELEDLINDK